MNRVPNIPTLEIYLHELSPKFPSKHVLVLLPLFLVVFLFLLLLCYYIFPCKLCCFEMALFTVCVVHVPCFLQSQPTICQFFHWLSQPGNRRKNSSIPGAINRPCVDGAVVKTVSYSCNCFY